MTRALVALVVAAGLAAGAGGCGSSSAPDAQALHDVEGAVRAVNRAIGVHTAFMTVGNVDTGATPEIIATSLWGRVMAEASGCVTATHTGATVHADFAADCMLATASMRAGGSVDIVVEPEATGGRRATMTLQLTVDGELLAGDFVVSTPNGQSFTFSADALTLGATTVTVPLVKAGIAGGGATMDALNATAGAAGAGFSMTAVHQRFAGCYADEGVATLGAVTVTFSSVTPQTGAVQLAAGRSGTLPPRTGCPR
ncbi:MAG: hypothetical protein JWN44_1398 [Myxococcales bacterium]|nr:hypothetical protein [Myxococcales bacterium]